MATSNIINFQNKWQLIILCLGTFSLGIAQNQVLRFTEIADDHGKPVGKITAITQDQHGYMWFAGNSEKCIYRYDGNRMIRFKREYSNPNSLGINNTETIYADDDGMIWIGGEGLDQYNPVTGIFKHYRNIPNDSNSLASNRVDVILKDRQGRLWVGTDKGLDHLDEKSENFIHYRHEAGNPGSLSSNAVRAIYEDHRGVIWIGTGFPFFPPDKPNTEGGLNRLNADGSFTRYLHDPDKPNSLVNNKVRAIFEDSRGVFWVGTSGDGLHIMDREKGSFKRLSYNPLNPKGLSRSKPKYGADHITFFNEDSTGSIWIGTYANGITRYHPSTNKVDHYQFENATVSTAWCGFISRDGVLWIGTEDSKKLLRVDPFLQSIENVSTEVAVTSFAEDKNRHIWMGSQGSGLFKYNQDKKWLLQVKPDPSDSFRLLGIRTVLFQNQEDSIWVRTDHGVRILNPITQQFSWFQDYNNLKDSLGRGLSKIIRDEQGYMWFGNWGRGLIRYNPHNNSYKYFLSDAQDSSTIASNFVKIILRDRSGILWSGGPDGISRLNGETGKFKRYLEGNFINSFYEDSAGDLWTGTETGLFRYQPDKDQFSIFTDPQSEINSYTVGGIIEDNGKNLWFSSQLGIIKLNPFTRESFIFGSKYGINPTSLVLWAENYKSKNGDLFISNDHGFYTFSPQDFIVKTKMKIILTDFFINTLPVLPGQTSPLTRPVEDIDELVLRYNQNNIAFNFSAIDFRQPQTTKYFTLLENYDNTWREAKGEKSSYYFNVPAGNYTYRVKAFNTDGTRGEKVVAIRINPPWWKTNWAYFMYGVFLIASLFSVFRFQKQRIIHLERQKAQAKELDQAKEIEKAYHNLKITQNQLIQAEKMASLGELTAGIAHEIKNPLNFINNFSEINLELLTEIHGDGPSEVGMINVEARAIQNLMNNSERINQHGKRVDSIVQGMLQHSKQANQTKEPVNVNMLCEDSLKLAYHRFRSKHKTFNGRYDIRKEPELPTILAIPQDIARVLVNLIDNAFYAIHQKDSIQDLATNNDTSGIPPQEDSLKGIDEQVYQPLVILSTKKLTKGISITIADNGVGIPVSMLGKIFQPFFTTKPAGEGTGLGLSMVYDIITKGHGGTITVNSIYQSPGGTITVNSIDGLHGGEHHVKFSEGTGTEFEIILPVRGPLNSTGSDLNRI